MHYITEAKKENEFSEKKDNIFFYYALAKYKIVTVHSVHSNALRDAQKSCSRMISRRNSRVFCELCSQKTPRGTLPVNSNDCCSQYRPYWKKSCECMISVQCEARYQSGCEQALREKEELYL